MHSSYKDPMFEFRAFLLEHSLLLSVQRVLASLARSPLQNTELLASSLKSRSSAMRTPALQFSLLAAALSPTLVQAAPFTPSTPFSPRLAPDSPRPSGNFGRSETLAPRSGGLGLGFIAARDVQARDPSFLGTIDE